MRARDRQVQVVARLEAVASAREEGAGTERSVSGLSVRAPAGCFRRIQRAASPAVEHVRFRPGDEREYGPNCGYRSPIRRRNRLRAPDLARSLRDGHVFVVDQPSAESTAEQVEVAVTIYVGKLRDRVDRQRKVQGAGVLEERLLCGSHVPV